MDREKKKKLGMGNILYTRKMSERNEVGVILDETIKSKVVEVVRESDQIIAVKLA